MFKLKTIANSGTSAPETIRLPKIAGKTFRPGELLRLESSRLNYCTSTSYPDYVSLGTFSGSDALCFAVTEDMIFDCECNDKTKVPVIGDRYDIYADSTSALELGDMNSEGAAIILAVNGKTISVRFVRNFMM